MNEGYQAAFHHFNFTGPTPAPGVEMKAKLLEHCRTCSFSNFWWCYHFVSLGPNKGKRQLIRRPKPAVVVVRPQMPRSWRGAK
eukprot:6185559-Pleurochrysis_carterae.AAC.1